MSIKLFGAELTPVTTLAQLRRILGRCADGNQSAVVFSEPGLGKSATVADMALAANRPLFSIHGPHHGPEDFKFPVVRNAAMERLASSVERLIAATRHDANGAEMPDMGGLPAEDQGRATVRWVQSVFPTDPNWDGIVFVDEFGWMPPAVQAALLGLFNNGERRIGTDYVLPPKATVVGASNLMTDGSGSGRTISPMVLRVNKLVYKPDCSRSLSSRTYNDEFCDWLAARNYPAGDDVISFVRCYPDKLHDYDADRVADSTTPRGWAEVAQLLDAKPDPDDRFLVAGKIGPSAADTFCAHRELTVRIDPLAVVANPDTATVPDDQPSLLWATIGAVAGVAKQADHKQKQGIVKYLLRCPAEYAVFGIVDAMSKAPDIYVAAGDAGKQFIQKFGPLMTAKMN